MGDSGQVPGQTNDQGSGSKRGQAETQLRRILELMGFAASVSSREAGGQITLTVDGEDVGRLIGKHGQTLDALQFLLNRMNGAQGYGADGARSQARSDEERLPIRVDTSDGYRERREDSLVDLARRLAEKVRRTGEPVAMNPMPPLDRKVVHTALGAMADVTTRSEGEGANRYVVIAPATLPSSLPDEDGDSTERVG